MKVKSLRIQDVKQSGILYIIGSLSPGGTENHLCQITSCLAKRGWRVDICLLSPYIGISDRFLDKNVNIIHLPYALSENFITRNFLPAKFIVLIIYSILILKLILKRNHKFVHMFLPQAYLIGGIISFVCRVPIKVMSRRSLNIYQKRYPIAQYLEKFLHSKMDLIMGNSNSVTKELISEGAERGNLHLIYNGINLNLFENQANRQDIRKRLHLAPHDFVIFYVANLIEYKGHSDLIKAVGKIKYLIPNLKLFFIGRDSGIKKGLIDQLCNNDLKKFVFFIENENNVYKFLKAADVGMLCSHQEGFSNSILEYMGAGLPVIATRVGGNEEAVIDGETGYIVEPHNPKEISEAILKIYRSKNRVEIGEKGRNRVKKHFSLEHCVYQYELAYLNAYKKKFGIT